CLRWSLDELNGPLLHKDARIQDLSLNARNHFLLPRLQSRAADELAALRFEINPQLRAGRNAIEGPGGPEAKAFLSSTDHIVKRRSENQLAVLVPAVLHLFLQPQRRSDGSETVEPQRSVWIEPSHRGLNLQRLLLKAAAKFSADQTQGSGRYERTPQLHQPHKQNSNQNAESNAAAYWLRGWRVKRQKANQRQRGADARGQGVAQTPEDGKHDVDQSEKIEGKENRRPVSFHRKMAIINNVEDGKSGG